MEKLKRYSDMMTSAPPPGTTVADWSKFDLSDDTSHITSDYGTGTTVKDNSVAAAKDIIEHAIRWHGREAVLQAMQQLLDPSASPIEYTTDKVAWIKAYRASTGLGLKEAKDECDQRITDGKLVVVNSKWVTP